jgi:hypothetical protein
MRIWDGNWIANMKRKIKRKTSKVVKARIKLLRFDKKHKYASEKDKERNKLLRELRSRERQAGLT